MVQAGDKCDFIGTLIVVPDVSQLRTEGTITKQSNTIFIYLIHLQELELRLPRELKEVKGRILKE